MGDMIGSDNAHKKRDLGALLVEIIKNRDISVEQVEKRFLEFGANPGQAKQAAALIQSLIESEIKKGKSDCRTAARTILANITCPERAGFSKYRKDSHYNNSYCQNRDLWVQSYTD
jgi:hypothetical protein